MSSLLGNREIEVELNVSPQQFHDLLSNRPHHVSNASSGKVLACSLHDGEWGKQGSVISWNYVHDGKAKDVKERVESIDPKNNSITFRVIEGELLNDFKSLVFKVQASPKKHRPDSVVRVSADYEKLHDAIADPETLVELAAQIFKDVDSHIIQGN